jgi:RNA polymerase sigma-70 factor (ECF subfamily)
MSIEVFTQRILPMKDKLFRFALRLLRDVQEAEDAVQDVMVRIWSKKEEWGQWQNLEAYCMRATRNTCVDRMRRQRIHQVQEERAGEIRSSDRDPHEKMMDKETGQRIRKCMEELPENQQMVIQLREMEGFSYNEIAEILDLSMEQVKINLFRARNTIKKLIIKQEAPWNTRNTQK